MQERVTSSEFDKAISEILGEIATKSVIKDVKKNLKKNSVPKVLIQEDFVPTVINHDTEILDFMIDEAQEQEIECCSKG